MKEYRKYGFIVNFSILLLVGTVGAWLLMGATPTWIQYNERVVGENSPAGYPDVVNRPGKAIWANFTSQHTIDGEHKGNLDTVQSPTTWRIFYTDGSNILTELSLGSSGQVLQSNGASAAPTWEDPVSTSPVGSVTDYAGVSAPTGWLLCDGSAVSRSTYSALYSNISTLYGAGDGSTTFNVPDLRGRTTIGAGTGSGLTARSLSATGGEESHSLTEAENGAHSHLYYFATTGASYDVSGASIAYSLQATSSSGSGTAHNTMMPYGVLNKIIKY